MAKKDITCTPSMETQNAASSLELIPESIERMIYTARNEQVMIDFDLAVLYGIENRSLRQSVRRNIDKFPEDFLFRLTPEEANELVLRRVSQNVIPPRYNTGGADIANVDINRETGRLKEGRILALQGILIT